MRNIWSLLFITGLAATFSLTSCKKKETETQPKPEVKQNDQAASSATDAAIDDVNDFINNSIGGGSNKNARLAAYNLPCGIVKVDSSGTGTQKTYTLNYGSQTRCGYKYKSGKVSFQLSKGNRFDSLGAIFTIQYVDFKVESMVSGDVVTLNGMLSITNLTGGYVWQTVVQSRTIEHRLRGKLNVTFANNQTREKNYFQRRTWASTNGFAGLTFTINGDSSVNNISETGKTYDGNYDYQTQILNAFTWSNCGSTYAGPYVLKTGSAKMNVIVPNVSPAYFQVEAGYYQDLTSASSMPTLTNNCSANAYKISMQLGTTSTIQYQLY